MANNLGHTRILCDLYHEAEFARPNLDIHLPNLYRTESELIAVFLCAEYSEKRWCKLEWRYIRQLIDTDDEGRIMLLSFDDVGPIPEIGILSGDAYLYIGNRSADEIAELILQRLEHENQPNPGRSTFGKERTPEWLTIPDRPWTGIPGALLRADLAIVPFHGRDDELAALTEWATGERKESVALVTGSGGMGKTRLARELSLELRAEGILCGFVEPSDVDRCVGFLRARANVPMLLVIDYAETIEDRIADILKVVSKRNLTALRILLLARSAGYWWTKLKRMGAGIGDHLTREPEKLRPLTLGIEARRHSYYLAASAFAERLKRPKPKSEPSDLGASDYERALLLHMTALLAVQDIRVQGMDSILQGVLAREAEYWFKELDNRQLPKLLEPGFERLVGIIGGYGGVRNQREAIEVISKISFFSDQPRAMIEAIANILHDCYPGALWIEPIQPDLLNEYLVEKATREFPDDFKRIVL